MGAVDCDEPLTDYTPQQMEQYVRGILKHMHRAEDTYVPPATVFILLQNRRTL